MCIFGSKSLHVASRLGHKDFLNIFNYIYVSGKIKEILSGFFYVTATLSHSIRQKSGKFITVISLIYQEKHTLHIKTDQRLVYFEQVEETFSLQFQFST